ncbi:MAG TPA: methyltransferase domain-containing protein [Candidatus Sulfotelmatobacter sp.]|nr:methyltransferase domain-containing protein [Candidatus Sulfotelmatobacter sp.]
MSPERQAATRAFYDAYWPANVPDYRRTRAHVLAAVPEAAFARALDAGCGTGVCSLALAERAGRVVGFDLSGGSLRTARRLAEGAGAKRLAFAQGSLLQLPFPDASFDLVWSWGVVHHTADPARALDELARVLRPGGTLVLALYWRTLLTPFHEAARRRCLRLGPAGRRRVIAAVGAAVRAAVAVGFRHQTRDDNPDVRAQVEDWFFVPEKHFFTPRRTAALLAERGLTCEVVDRRTGRFKSSSNFVVRGVKAAPARALDEATYDAGWGRKWGDCCRYGPSLRHRQRLVAEVVRGLGVRSLLDTGCGNGVTLRHLLADVPIPEVHGADLSPEAVAQAARAIPEGSFRRLDIVREHLDRTFDLVLCCDVLEHIEDDLAALRHMRSMTGRYLLATTIQGTMRPSERCVGHVRNYTRAGLEARLRQAGFIPERTIEWGFPFYSPIHRALLEGAGPRISEGRFGPLRRGLAALVYALFFLNSSRRGDVLITLARPAPGSAP